MMSMKRIYVPFLISLAAMVFLYQSSVVAKQPLHKAKILFFQHADLGAISPEKASRDCYHIQLSHLKEQVIYFANEPARTTGVMNWADFALTWVHNDIHPNAVIHALKDKKLVNDTVTLFNLEYDKTNHTASYKACSLNPNSKLATGQLVDVSIFLDPFHPWP
jgi:hypothetical protein